MAKEIRTEFKIVKCKKCKKGWIKISKTQRAECPDCDGTGNILKDMASTRDKRKRGKFGI